MIEEISVQAVPVSAALGAAAFGRLLESATLGRLAAP